MYIRRYHDSDGQLDAGFVEHTKGMFHKFLMKSLLDSMIKIHRESEGKENWDDLFFQDKGFEVYLEKEDGNTVNIEVRCNLSMENYL